MVMVFKREDKVIKFKRIIIISHIKTRVVVIMDIVVSVVEVSRINKVIEEALVRIVVEKNIISPGMVGEDNIQTTSKEINRTGMLQISMVNKGNLFYQKKREVIKIKRRNRETRLRETLRRKVLIRLMISRILKTIGLLAKSKMIQNNEQKQ